MTPEEFEDALAIHSNNVAAKVQMHVHSHTCTKYQRKEMKGRLETQPVFRVVASTAVRSSVIQSVLLQSVSLGSP